MIPDLEGQSLHISQECCPDGCSEDPKPPLPSSRTSGNQREVLVTLLTARQVCGFPSSPRGCRPGAPPPVLHSSESRRHTSRVRVCGGVAGPKPPLRGGGAFQSTPIL